MWVHDYTFQLLKLVREQWNIRYNIKHKLIDWKMVFGLHFCSSYLSNICSNLLIWKPKYWIKSFFHQNIIVDIWIWMILEKAVSCLYIWTERFRSFGRVWTYQHVKLLRKIIHITSKISFICIHILQPQGQLLGGPASILQLQLQNTEPERTQDYFTRDQLVRMWKVFVAIAHTCNRPFLPPYPNMNQ